MAEMAIISVVSEAGTIKGMTGSVVLASIVRFASRWKNKEEDNSMTERPVTNRLARIAEIKQTRKAR